MPLKPGTRFTYEGTTIEDDGAAVPHRVVINVTDLTKVIGGGRSLADTAKFARDTIKPALEQVDGVASVDVKDRELRGPIELRKLTGTRHLGFPSLTVSSLV